MSIEAMKQAHDLSLDGKHFEARQLLLEAIATEESSATQEPVAWGVDWGKAGDVPCVSIIKRKSNGDIEVLAVEYAPYTHSQQKREWVGLTDEQRDHIVQNSLNVAVSIEDKLKEKNQ